MDTLNETRIPVRPTTVEGGILWLICCVLGIVTDRPTLSAASRIVTKFEVAQVVVGENPNSALNSKVTFNTVVKGNRSGVHESLQHVARNQNEWAMLWQQHTAAETIPSVPPVVDFNKEMVIAIFLGEKPTGGHAVEITLIERKDGDLVISYKEFYPAPGAIATQALTQPFHVVRVAKNGEPKVVFRRDS